MKIFMALTFPRPRRILGAAWLMLLALLLSIGSLWPASPLKAQSGITSPTTGSTVSGDVPIMGTAVIDPFQKYELHFKLEPSGDDAYIYFAGATSPVANGQLGIWIEKEKLTDDGCSFWLFVDLDSIICLDDSVF